VLHILPERRDSGESGMRASDAPQQGTRSGLMMGGEASVSLSLNEASMQGPARLLSGMIWELVCSWSRELGLACWFVRSDFGEFGIKDNESWAYRPLPS
jgi:hypothetical protein